MMNIYNNYDFDNHEKVPSYYDEKTGYKIIIGTQKQGKTKKLFEFFGNIVEGLGGSYITAEDVGI